MDRAQFELIGNVGKLEIKTLNAGKKLAVISLATAEKWKSAGEPFEQTHWHRVAVFGENRVALIERAVQMGTRLRLVGQIRQNKWEDNSGQTRYGTEFIISGIGEVEILARGKPREESADDMSSEPKANRRKKAA